MVSGTSSTSSEPLSGTWPPAASTSLIRNGAPAAAGTRNRPIASGGSTGMSRRTSSASNGTSTKLARTARITALTLRSGSRIWRTVWPRPTESMPATANTMTERSSSVERTAVISLLPIPAARARCEKTLRAAPGVLEAARSRGQRAFLAPRTVVRSRVPAPIAPPPCPAHRSLEGHAAARWLTRCPEPAGRRRSHGRAARTELGLGGAARGARPGLRAHHALHARDEPRGPDLLLRHLRVRRRGVRDRHGGLEAAPGATLGGVAGRRDHRRRDQRGHVPAAGHDRAPPALHHRGLGARDRRLAHRHGHPAAEDDPQRAAPHHHGRAVDRAERSARHAPRAGSPHAAGVDRGV